MEFYEFTLLPLLLLQQLLLALLLDSLWSEDVNLLLPCCPCLCEEGVAALLGCPQAGDQGVQATNSHLFNVNVMPIQSLLD